MSYHIDDIPKGKLGEFSKINEEFHECCDAYKQNNTIMLLLEFSDLIGAIEAYIQKHNLSLDDIIQMKNSTQRAFASGHRK